MFVLSVLRYHIGLQAQLHNGTGPSAVALSKDRARANMGSGV